MKNDNRAEHPPDGYVTNARPWIFGPRKFIPAEEMSQYSKQQLDSYDRLPRKVRDWMKEHGG